MKWGAMQRWGIFMVCFLAAKAPAQNVVELPEEELAKESVMPKFDHSVSVKNRNIVTDGKIEVGAYGGANFAEPIYNQKKIGFNLGYHYSEEAAIVLNYAQWMSGLNTQYTDALSSQYGLDFSRAPALQSTVFVDWELKSYYGKISLTKQTAMNMHLYPILGLGMTKYSSKAYFGGAGGVGWKFYFSNAWALRADFKLQYMQGPSPFLKQRMKTTDPVPDPGEFADKWAFGTVMDLGVSFFF